MKAASSSDGRPSAAKPDGTSSSPPGVPYLRPKTVPDSLCVACGNGSKRTRTTKRNRSREGRTIDGGARHNKKHLTPADRTR
mmetsp:Transcript_23852/g.47426  ORF Transcript_23852/g.47426 Transcript_23852/m.47426 type:complete len:82 (-) Transcript_23852:875-1120(-)